jgi:hypothetical protein
MLNINIAFFFILLDYASWYVAWRNKADQDGLLSISIDYYRLLYTVTG